MATTPPPRSRRVHTPPAPGGDDEWTPFTPRRSNRVAAQRTRFVQTPQSGRLAPPPSNIFQVSPPASPLSPSHPTPRHSIKSSYRKQQKPRPQLAQSGSETEIEESRMPTSAVLPTPLKTPRKKALSKEALNSTSRVLFHPRLANIEDAMPTPKKTRRPRAYSLDPHADAAAGLDSIEVYEDSKERVPAADYDQDNPFLVAPGTSRRRSSRPRAKSARERDAEAMVNNEEGVVYVL
jgi:hypothetical protein